jgi:hypothetical protein
MKDLPDAELIRLYTKESANETSDLPWGAEKRRKAYGDELLSRGIAEFTLPAFGMVFKVRGSEVDAMKIEQEFERTPRPERRA